MLKVEQALRAVLDDVHDEGEEAGAEVWVELELTLDHAQGASTEPLIDDR